MLAASKKNITSNVIVVGDDYNRYKSLLLKIVPSLWIFLIFFVLSWKNFRVLRFKKYPWFHGEKLSRFDDLEFPTAETFAKMTKKRETRESWCPRKFLPLKYPRYATIMHWENLILIRSIKTYLNFLTYTVAIPSCPSFCVNIHSMSSNMTSIRFNIDVTPCWMRERKKNRIWLLGAVGKTLD